MVTAIRSHIFRIRLTSQQMLQQSCNSPQGAAFGRHGRTLLCWCHGAAPQTGWSSSPEPLDWAGDSIVLDCTLSTQHKGSAAKGRGLCVQDTVGCSARSDSFWHVIARTWLTSLSKFIHLFIFNPPNTLGRLLAKNMIAFQPHFSKKPKQPRGCPRALVPQQ